MAHGTTRAKSGRLKVRKKDKSGRSYIGQDEVTVSAGIYSAKEMEQELQRAADETDGEVVDAEVETYEPGVNPDNFSDPLRGFTGTHTQWGGFQGASWLPESPLIRKMKERDGTHR